jgi:hypothetical protein
VHAVRHLLLLERGLHCAIQERVAAIRSRLATERNAGKATGYLSIPISTVQGSYFKVNLDVAADVKKRVETKLGSSFGLVRLRCQRLLGESVMSFAFDCRQTIEIAHQCCWRTRHDSNVWPLPSEGSALSS